MSLEQKAKIAAALLRAQAVPCSIFSDSQSCDNLGEPLPYDFGSGGCGLAPPHLRPDWKEYFRRSAEYRLIGYHAMASNYEALAQEAVFQALVDDDDVPDLQYWRERGAGDARSGRDECFRREAMGVVRAKGSFSDDWSEAFEHVAGEAYLMGFWNASDEEGT